MTDTRKESRRRFLLGAGALAVLGGGLARAQIASAQAKKSEIAKGGEADLPLVDPKSSLAVTLKYDHDAAKIPAALKVAKGGVDGAKQNCANCIFYAKVGSLKGGPLKGEEVGKCQLFPQGNVTAKGWCTSWMKKP
jgi:hypothetical protein